MCRELCALWPKSACSNSCTSQVRDRECFTRDVQHGGPWTAVGAELKGLQLCSTSGPGEVLHSRSQPACFARSCEQGPIHTLLHISGRHLGAPASQLIYIYIYIYSCATFPTLRGTLPAVPSAGTLTGLMSAAEQWLDTRHSIVHRPSGQIHVLCHRSIHRWKLARVRHASPPGQLINTPGPPMAIPVPRSCTLVPIGASHILH